MADQKLTYRLKQSQRKTISVYVSNDGSIDVLAPRAMDKEEIDTLVHKKIYLIQKKRAEFRVLNETRRSREAVSGETFQYLGRNYRLEFDPDCPELILKDGRFRISRRPQEEVFQSMVDFYRERGKIKIRERVEHFSLQMGLDYRHIRIMDLKTRWASCNDHGDVNFHWKCMMAPLQILDYVVVHELAHLKHHRHTDAFWALVDRVLPDYRDRKEWLKLNGAGMDL